LPLFSTPAYAWTGGHFRIEHRPARDRFSDEVPRVDESRIDVLVVTALKDELDALLDLEVDGAGRSAWTEERDRYGFPFHVRQLSNEHGEPLRLAAAWSGEMGETAATERPGHDAQQQWLSYPGTDERPRIRRIHRSGGNALGGVLEPVGRALGNHPEGR
jgi:hypothetical protein